MQSKLPNHKHSKSNLFTKVGDVASAVHAVKSIYDAGKFLYNAGRVAYPYMAAMAVKKLARYKWEALVNFETMLGLLLVGIGGKLSIF